MQDDIELPDEEEAVVFEDDEIATEESTEPVELETVQQKEDDGKQDDTEEYGKKVNKRINKLVAERNIERDDNAKLRTRLDKLEQTQSETVQAREDGETSSKITDIKRRKMAYMEEGEFAKAEELNDEMLDLKIKQTRQAVKEPEQDQGHQQTNNPQQSNAPSEATTDWLKSNTWYTDNGNSAKAKYATALHQELIDEGYDLNDAETYSELDSRLGVTAKPEESNPRPPAQSAPDRGQSRGDSKNSQVKFTQNDVRTMREFGLDPNNASQRAEWLNNKG